MCKVPEYHTACSPTEQPYKSSHIHCVCTLTRGATTKSSWVHNLVTVLAVKLLFEFILFSHVHRTFSVRTTLWVHTRHAKNRGHDVFHSDYVITPLTTTASCSLLLLLSTSSHEAMAPAKCKHIHTQFRSNIPLHKDSVITCVEVTQNPKQWILTKSRKVSVLVTKPTSSKASEPQLSTQFDDPQPSPKKVQKATSHSVTVCTIYSCSLLCILIIEHRMASNSGFSTKRSLPTSSWSVKA